MLSKKYVNSCPSLSYDLLTWYKIHQRQLPWRIPFQKIHEGIKPNPYHVWLSEVMLQQTIVKTVEPYFKKFLKKWPSLRALHLAPIEDILQNWSGLGYYSRARNLKICANEIFQIYKGKFPTNFEELKKLKGIGDYTAAAIASIAFEENVAVVDGNIKRIISRIYMIDDITTDKNIIHQKMQNLMPQIYPGNFVQAMMDLGALICKPKNPLCAQCPIQTHCLAFKNEKQKDFPPKFRRPEKKNLYGCVFIAHTRDHKILLQKRKNKGFLANMMQLPNYFEEKKLDNFMPLFEEEWRYFGEIKHEFTHLSFNLSVYRAENVSPHDLQYQNADNFWCPLNSIEKQALPSLFKKALKKTKDWP